MRYRSLAVAASAAIYAACGSSSPARTSPPSGPVKPAPARVDNKPAVDAARLAKQLDAYIGSVGKHLGEAHRFSGFVLVAQGDRVVYERGWGYADRAAQRRADRNTSFRIGSVTKQFTAVAILQLQDKGLLSVHDKVRKHLPDYPAVGSELTIHHLLTHTGGVPNYTNDKALMAVRDKEIGVNQLLARFSAKPLEFVVGSKFAYSNSGYAVLGAIIEAVSKQSYHDYLRDHLFTPAGLTSTLYGDARGAANRSRGYRVDDQGRIVAAKPFAMSMAFAAGGVRSTAADLWRWHRALQTRTLLSPAARKMMYTPVKERYGYGWVIADVGGKRVIAHDGGIDGFGTSYVRIMDDDIVIVAWTNNPDAGGGASANAVARAAAKVAMGKTVEPVKEQLVAPALAKRVAGSYVLSDASKKLLARTVSIEVVRSVEVMDILVRGKVLISKALGQPAIALEHTRGLAFAVKRLEATLTFSGGEPAGPTAKLTLVHGGIALEFARDEGKAAEIKRRFYASNP